MSIRVKIVLAQVYAADWIDVELAAGTTVEQAVRMFGMNGAELPSEAFEGRVGIYGKLVPLSRPLGDGDRIEIYRPLQADAKSVRRARANKPSRRTR